MSPERFGVQLCCASIQTHTHAGGPANNPVRQRLQRPRPPWSPHCWQYAPQDLLSSQPLVRLEAVAAGEPPVGRSAGALNLQHIDRLLKAANGERTAQ